MLLIRHGQTEWNRQEIFRGRADTPLSEEGVKQALVLAERLARAQISAVYSSPLARARTTAQYLAKVHGLQPLPVDGFTDLSYGKWEGQPRERVKVQYPDLLARWESEPHLVRPPGGEMLAEVSHRAHAALDQVVTQHPDQTVAVVSHRVVNKLLLCSILGLGDSAFWRLRQNTGCLNVLGFESDQVVLALMNDTCHLRGLPQDAVDF